MQEVSFNTTDDKNFMMLIQDQLFQQKFMYKRYLTSGKPEGKGMFVKTEIKRFERGSER